METVTVVPYRGEVRAALLNREWIETFFVLEEDCEIAKNGGGP